MAKKSSIEKNKKRQRLIAKFAAKREALRKVIHDPNSNISEVFEANLKLSKLPRNSMPIRYRRRCNLTGRPRGYYRKFDMSRICLREYAAAGELPGVTKSSW